MNKKHFVKVVATLSAVTMLTVSTFGATFTDIKTTNWAYSALQNMQERGIMLPNSKGEILPSKTMDYFELSDVLAKASGFTKAEDQAAIAANYERQKATIEKYSSKYTSWNKLYDKQIAYLLGRGYITEADLTKFVVKATTGTEVKRVATKQDLAVYAVRILGKELTAKEAYATSKTTGFSDEKVILEANRPHVAYLKAIGLVTGDETGAFGGNLQVTRALCAKMVSDVLAYKEKLEQTEVVLPSNTQSITVEKIMNKTTNELFVKYTTADGKSTWGTIKKETTVTDASGKVIDLNTLINTTLNKEATVTLETLNDTTYIQSMQFKESNVPSIDTSSTTYKGKVARVGTYGDITLTLADGSSKTFIVAENAVITLDGKSVSLQELYSEDSAVATVQNGYIVKLEALKGSISISNSVTEGELIARKVTGLGHVFTVSQNGKTLEWVVANSAVVRRNGNKVDLYDIRIGDTLKITKEEGEIKTLEATGKRQTVEGTVSAIYLGGVSQVTLDSNNKQAVYTVNAESEFYDNNLREYIALRDVRLGQTVELYVDSKEIISLVVQRDTSSAIKYIGVIQDIGSGNEYMDVLVNYDPLTSSSNVLKRIRMPITTSVVIEGKESHRSELKEGKDVLITFRYLDDASPEKIVVLE
ncbi:hypothetical protein CS063_11985 [Sporanaerobium hydrogeniformans]|uniref:Uncharacterized protein n=1 Tax=Sporanaerobium hydrogeniformans TaxID=3072179 RepID=A0AC61DC18_9FIRM|nr:S-layer homology domain-containing protein [Sporanaerobium hydrogeniformans]PHV70191.1 hypothetical protein CS063_11985 [Sporanaerobium hydrogeniformans]